MSKYGKTIYGSDFYGPDSSALLRTTMDASPSNYGEVTLTWATPGSTWTRLRLVRNSYGFPTTADDGVVLFDSNSGPAATGTLDPPITSFVDSGLKQGRYYYYSLFAQRGIGFAVTWTRCADASAQAVADHDYENYMLDRIPGIFTNDAGEVEGDPTSTPIRKFASLLGFDLARTRDSIDHLALLREPDLLAGPLVPALMNTVGVSYEPEIGLRNNRVLARNAVFLSRIKGTADSVTGMASALTGYGAEILPAKNLMLGRPMASFEGSYDPWVISSGTATLSCVTSPSPVSGSYSLQVTPTTTSVSLVHVNSTQHANAYGIPVVAGATYAVSGYAEAGGATAAMYLDITWYSRTGAVISTTSGASAPSTSVSTWSARTNTNGTAPAGAVWAGVTIRLTGLTAATPIYLDCLQFERSAGGSTTYETARLVNLHLIAPRINEINNAGFDNDTTGWAVTNCTLVRDTVTVFNSGLGSGKVTPSGSLDATAQTSFGALPNTPFTVSCQVHPTSTGPFHLRLEFYDANGVLQGSTTGATVSCTGGAWKQLSLSTTIPGTANHGVLKVVEQAGTGGVFYLDDVLGEHTNVVKPYFDVHTDPGDVYFDGAQGESRSHLYPNSLTMTNRLTAWLPKYLPFWASYKITLAQPEPIDYYGDTYVDTY